MSVLPLYEAFQRVMPMETHSEMNERSTDRDFNALKGAWKTRIVLKALSWRCNIVDFGSLQPDQNLRNILKMLSQSAIDLQSASAPSEWPLEGCTCTMFMEVFSKRFQQHLKAQRRLSEMKKKK